MTDGEDGFWDNDHTSEEEVMHAEAVATQEAARAPRRRPAPRQESVDLQYPEDNGDEFPERSAQMGPDESEEDYDEQEVLSDASLRLEQAQLYKMLLVHDLFGEVDSSPEAIRNVTREVRRFIKERLEIFLGIRAPEQPRATADSQFSEIEARVLKSLVHKATGGQAGEPMGQGRSVPTPVGQQAPARQAQPPTPLRSGPSGRPQRRAEPPLRYRPLKKSPYEMDPDELLARNEEIVRRQAAAKAPPPSDRLPMPSTEAQEALYASRMDSTRVGGPGLMQQILAQVEKNRSAASAASR